MGLRMCIDGGETFTDFIVQGTTVTTNAVPRRLRLSATDAQTR